MASKRVAALGGDTLYVQGFRPGGGIDSPYVHVTIVDQEGFDCGGFDLQPQFAQELGEVLRQEAEAASRQEGDK